MTVWKLGTIWGTNAPDYYEMILKRRIALSHTDVANPVKGDYIFVTKGYDVKAITVLLEDPQPVTTNPGLQNDFNKYSIAYDKEVLYAKADWVELEDGDHLWYEHQKGITRINKQDIIEKGISLYKKYKMNQEQNRNQNEIIELLKNKCQIILQGPPGTGKTRMAKMIAKEMVASQGAITITKFDIEKYLTEGTVIKTLKDKNEFSITGLDETIRIKLLGTNTDYAVSFQRIIDCLKNNDLTSTNQEAYKNNVGPYILGIAKFIKEKYSEERIKIVQFHPAYSYEDFVRGITAKTDSNNNVEYRTENRVLGEFAAIASKNYNDSKKDTKVVSKEKWLLDSFEAFKDLIEDELATKDRYPLSESGYIYEIDEDAFRYKGDNWGSNFRIPFSELLKLYNLGIAERREIKSQDKVLGSTKQHATYHFNLLMKFKAFIEQRAVPVPVENSLAIPENNYVLIIDEINRANLPAVLGELIYALEYRGDAVQSIYDINNDRTLLLPPNLYIIGTMNSADRSVSHIDYAIRRRFAFVSVMPSSLAIEEFILDPILREKAKNLFDSVSKLFTKEFLASDFDPNDVQLGHSYFLATSEELLRQKLKYEIQPLLREYKKDGILLEGANDKIEELNV